MVMAFSGQDACYRLHSPLTLKVYFCMVSCRYSASLLILGPSSNLATWQWKQLTASWWCTRAMKRRRQDVPAAASSTASSIFQTPSTRSRSSPVWNPADDWSSRHRSHTGSTSERPTTHSDIETFTRTWLVWEHRLDENSQCHNSPTADRLHNSGRKLGLCTARVTLKSYPWPTLSVECLQFDHCRIA